MPKPKKLHTNIQRAFGKLNRCGGLLCRQFSESEEAQKRGGSYVYFTVKDNEKFPTGSALFMIENGLVESCGDGLFAETPQTFRAVPFERFQQFKERYEAQQ